MPSALFVIVKRYGTGAVVPDDDVECLANIIQLPPVAGIFVVGSVIEPLDTNPVLKVKKSVPRVTFIEVVRSAIVNGKEAVPVAENNNSVAGCVVVGLLQIMLPVPLVLTCRGTLVFTLPPTLGMVPIICALDEFILLRAYGEA